MKLRHKVYRTRHGLLNRNPRFVKQPCVAEKEGFEPSDPVSQVNSLAVSPIRPLSHFSTLGEPNSQTVFHNHTTPGAN